MPRISTLIITAILSMMLLFIWRRATVWAGTSVTVDSSTPEGAQGSPCTERTSTQDLIKQRRSPSKLLQHLSCDEERKLRPEKDDKLQYAREFSNGCKNRTGIRKAAQKTRKERPQKECPPSTSHGYLDTTRGSKNTSCHDLTKLIIYSKLYEGFPAERFQGYQNCTLPDGVQCVYTEDDSLYQSADVLYVHDCFSYCQQPAYEGQIVIRYNLGPESRPCTDSELPPKMDIRVSYKTSVTIPMLYLCLPRIKQPILEALRLDPPKNRHGIAMFVSDCRSWRNKYLEELMKYIKIDSYGRCLHNTVMPESRKLTKDSNPFDIKLDILKKKRYKFLISFENTVTSEYITEKIWHGYLSQTIPIYYGASEIYEQVPGHNTFIDATKFKGPKELSEYIAKVDKIEQLYQSFFKFDIPPFEAFQKKFCVFEDTPLACDMCNRAYQIKQSRCN